MKATGRAGKSGSREESGPARPFASRRQEALVALLGTADRVRRYLRAIVEPAGITLQQYNVLRILRGAGGELPTMEIRERMMEQAPGITALLDRLERKDLLARHPDRHDRRLVHCRLTAAGERLLEGLDTAVDEADEEALAGLSDRQIERLIRLLNRGRASIPEG